MSPGEVVACATQRLRARKRRGAIAPMTRRLPILRSSGFPAAGSIGGCQNGVGFLGVPLPGLQPFGQACSAVFSFSPSDSLSGARMLRSMIWSSSSRFTSMRGRRCCFHDWLSNSRKRGVKRQTEDFLDRAVRLVGLVVFAAPGGEPEQLPVRRAVTGPAKTTGIDEGFREVNRVTVHPLPVV